jgi:predicted GNAT family N-acyltransferase
MSPAKRNFRAGGRRAGDPTGCVVRVADYGIDEPEIRALRFEVFVDEQDVPAEIEMDDRDPHCIHLLAFDNDKPVGTARIDLEQAGKVGRLAVLARWRRQGIGQRLMERCHEIAMAHGLESVWCNAQVGALPFYESLGYRVSGERFVEAGIDHRRMTRILNTPD